MNRGDTVVVDLVQHGFGISNFLTQILLKGVASDVFRLT